MCDDIEKELLSLNSQLSRWHWGRLRFIGNLRVLSVSYIIGAAVALPKLLGQEDILDYLHNPYIIWPLGIFVVGVSLGNLIYELFCPVIIKKFENLPVFYENQLRIKKIQKETYPGDPFNASLLHVGREYIKELGSGAVARFLALGLYVVSALALLFLAVSLYIFTV
jgi:hypothetical protein